jgi:hypothetical protein
VILGNETWLGGILALLSGLGLLGGGNSALGKELLGVLLLLLGSDRDLHGLGSGRSGGLGTRCRGGTVGSSRGGRLGSLIAGIGDLGKGSRRGRSGTTGMSRLHSLAKYSVSPFSNNFLTWY